MGFQSQLNSQIAEVEGLANGTNIQNLVLENYNGVTLGNDSPYYTNVTDLFATASDYAGNNVNYYLYDVNGYYITSSDNTNTDDWQEHMAIPVEDITETKILQCSPLDEIESIDVVSPIIIKSQIVGLIRANITSRYFGSFIPEDGSAFIMTNDGGYLFTSTGLTGQRELETQAFNCLNGADNAKDYGHLKASSFKNIYGFCKLSDSNWLYLIKQQGTQYQQILATLPITMSITLIIILMIAIWVSRILSAKYTEPIFTLRDNMTDASSGNLDVKCDVASDDEFGDLSRMFNSMMDIISNNYKELSASKAALEVSEQELKKNYAHIEQLAYHDGLTGLYNRVAFMKYAYKIFHDASVGASKHAIFFIDLDNFKNINDTLGHDYGDLLLKDVSDRMLSCIASDDILARNGGDEFLILKNRFDTVDDLENTLYSMQDKIDTLKKSASAKQSRIKELDELLRMADYYEDGKPVADKLKTIRFEKSRQKYKAEHDDTLRLFYMAERKLKRQVVDGKLPAAAWREEKARLETEYRDLQTELTPLYADMKKLWAIHYNIYEVQHEQERQNAAVRQKKQEIER